MLHVRIRNSRTAHVPKFPRVLAARHYCAINFCSRRRVPHFFNFLIQKNNTHQNTKHMSAVNIENQDDLTYEAKSAHRLYILKRLHRSTSSSISKMFAWLKWRLPNLAPEVRAALCGRAIFYFCALQFDQAIVDCNGSHLQMSGFLSRVLYRMPDATLESLLLRAGC